MTTARQKAWLDGADQAAARGNPLAAGLFALLAQPNDAERGHVCAGHLGGFSRDGRRGIKCRVCGKVQRWIDEEAA